MKKSTFRFGHLAFCRTGLGEMSVSQLKRSAHFHSRTFLDPFFTMLKPGKGDGRNFQTFPHISPPDIYTACAASFLSLSRSHFISDKERVSWSTLFWRIALTRPEIIENKEAVKTLELRARLGQLNCIISTFSTWALDVIPYLLLRVRHFIFADETEAKITDSQSSIKMSQ